MEVGLHNPMEARQETLLDIVLRNANDPTFSEREVIRCGGEGWTYSELHTVSSVTAISIASKYGLRPTVAIISENHPYVLALMLAVWKLGGVIACLDRHAPESLMEGMLRIVSPTLVFVNSLDTTNRRLITDLAMPLELIEPDQVTIANLSERCMHLSADLPSQYSHLPQPQDTCLYIFTSSATSLSNLKCVPLAHGVLVCNGRGQLASIPSHAPSLILDGVRVLGWSPFSHIMSVCLDFGTYTLLTAGCYIFGITPQSYSTQAEPNSASYDIPHLLLETVFAERPDIFAAVPWVMDGFMRIWQQQPKDKQDQTTEVLKNFKALILGGAAANEQTAEWAKSLGLPTLASLGMTELGGNLFYGRILRTTDTCIPDATIILVDDEGNAADEGELHITSRFIPKGYLNLDSSAFSSDAEGRITFKTGDIYARLTQDGEGLAWKGRKDDYIQLVSGESLDPRPIEVALNSCKSVETSCIVGDRFLSGSSRYICAIVQLAGNDSQDRKAARTEVTRVLTKFNRTLAPPLRIAWSRVLFLNEGQEIPMTRKRAVFRKKLESLFSATLSELLRENAETTTVLPRPGVESTAPIFSEAFVKETVLNVLSNVLRLHRTVLESDSRASFADYGMDSASAITVVNSLNNRLSISLPPNTCHSHVNLVSLTRYVLSSTGHQIAPDISEGTASSLSQASPYHSASEPPPIAVVGQALRLPGSINTPKSFWEALMTQRDDILTETPPDRWDDSSFMDSEACRITFRKSGFVDIANFDNSFFGISSPEAIYVMPSVRLVLEASFEALENANIPVSRVRGTDMSVFVAAGLDTGYSELLQLDKGWQAFNRYYGTGVAISTACGRLSYLLDIHGPSVTIETACSGGMVALDNAVRHLQSGRGEAAIVCSANTHTMPGMFGFLSAQKMTSSQSRCATFTDSADGYAPSEGVVALVLKTLPAALRDGDTIHGIIRSTNTMHNGRTQGLVAPSSESQAALQHSLLRLSSLKPSDIDFLEAHGTGTTLGDLIEIQGINNVFKASHTEDRPLVLGAAKACVGHTETASGLVGTVKALLSLQHGQVPGINHLTATNINPSLDCSVVPLRIPQANTALTQKPNQPWRALVMAYGFAGTISGAVLEAPPSPVGSPTQTRQAVAGTPFIFVVSAKSPPALSAYIDEYLRYCRQAPEDQLQSICYTSCVGREHYRYRFACVISSMQELIKALEEYRVQRPSTRPLPKSDLTVAFPGQGTHHFGMAKELSELFPAFKAILTTRATQASEIAEFQVLDLLLGIETDVDINSGVISQLCIFIYQCSVAEWLTDLGIMVNGLLGHSFGEIAAAVTGGCIEYSLGVRLVCNRAVALQSNPTNPGAMVAVNASEDDIRSCMDSLDKSLRDDVVIAVFNAAKSHTISGRADSVMRISDELKQLGYRTTKLNVEQGFHSPCISGGLDSFSCWLRTQTTRSPASFSALQIPVYSTVTSTKFDVGSVLGPDYWVDHARNPVKFSQAVQVLTQQNRSGVILDIGPQPTLWSILQQHNIDSQNWLILASTAKPGKSQACAFLLAIARLYENNISVNLSRLYRAMSIPFVKTTIPTYPFQRQHHYPAYIPSYNNLPSPVKPSSSNPRGETLLETDSMLLNLLSDHKIEGRRVLPGAAFADLLCRGDFNEVHHVAHIRFHRPFVLETTSSHLQIQHQDEGRFVVYQNDNTPDNLLCSGHIGYPSMHLKALPPVDEESPLIQTLDSADVYRSFRENIHFGPAFRNIQKLNIWDDHADGLICLSLSSNPQLNRIRQLDPCLHMFGALLPHIGKNLSEELLATGFFLPTSLEGFTLHTDDLPSTFICRYHLPFKRVGEKHPIISLGFQVLSLDGDILVTCMKYTVAWLPKGVAVRTSSSNQNQLPISWLHPVWKPAFSSDVSVPSHSMTADGTLVYIGTDLQPQNLKPFAQSAQDAVFIKISPPSAQYYHVDLKLHNDLAINLVPCNDGILQKGKVHVVVGPFPAGPESDTFVLAWHQILALMKQATSGQITIFSIVMISHDQPLTAPGLGPLLEGMLRVFRNEMGLSPKTAWALHLPTTLDPSAAGDLIRQELSMRNNGVGISPAVSYVEKEQTYERINPVFTPCTELQQLQLSNVAVVVGMGSIGAALGPALMASGCSKVVYLGRRPHDDPSVSKNMAKLTLVSADAFCYYQTDILELSILRNTLETILTECGPIKSIIHMAGVVKDAAINAVIEKDFEQVLKPKVNGAWNLHLLEQSLGLNLEAFVMTSSISVPLGNPGQIAYVAANSFMDALAVHRHKCGLHGLSLQLGAWESALIEGLETSGALVQPIFHEEGIPMIMKAMATPYPVQVIARMDLDKLANSSYKADPLFGEILASWSKGQPAVRPILSAEEMKSAILRTLKRVLEMREEEPLDPRESLTSLGFDSISFAQARGEISNKLGVDIPLKYLSEIYSINDMIVESIQGTS